MTTINSCRICLGIVHACERWHSSRSRCSAIFNQSGSSKPAHIPAERRKTNTRNAIESVKKVCLLWPCHPYPFSLEHPTLCVLRVLLRDFTKKTAAQKGVQPMPSHKKGPWVTCSLTDTASSRSCCWYIRTMLVMCYREFREMTRVKALVSTSLYSFKLSSLCLI